jgi:putative tricarboxylic transport membrane protein
MTTLDGYEMALQGRAGPALGIAAFGSFIAGTLSVMGLMLVAPPLARYALRFGPPEYFGLLFLSLTMLISLSGRSILKGLGTGLVGILLTSIGLDPVTGLTRLTFGVTGLMRGFDLIGLTIGIFGISEREVSIPEDATSRTPHKKGLKRIRMYLIL